MNPPKVTDEDYINFIIATPRDVTATEAERVQPESKNAPAHDAFTRLLSRLEPDAETLWAEARTQIDFNSGILVLDDSTLEKPYSERNALVYRHWSGKQKAVAAGINLITLLWTDGTRCVPVDYRIFDKDRDGKTKNDHFAEMLLQAHERGLNPQMVCFDSWYGSIENLKLVRSLGWHFLTRLKSNRQINVNRSGLQAVSEAGLCGGGTVVWLKGFGQIKVFRVRAEGDAAEYWATSIEAMSEAEREVFAKSAWRIEMYHRALKQQCLIERAQCRRLRPVSNHINLCIRAFVRLESHCYREKISWIEAKTSIIRDAVRAYLVNPRYLLVSPRCLVPKCDGVKCTSSINKESLWDKFYTAAPARLRHFAERLRHSQESLTRLAARYHINAKTVAKWRKRTTVKDAAMGPRRPHSTVLTTEQEAAIVAFRRQTLLPLDDCLYALQASIPNLTRSALHRCLQRHGISRLPDIKGDKPAKKKFAQYPIGYFHIDIAEVCTEQGRLYLFVAIDRTSKFTYAELHLDKTRDRACQFLHQLIAIVPYHIHTILTDNGIQFTNRLKDKRAFKHMFDRICLQHKIEHRLTKVNHPWTNGQVERMNRTIKDATVKRYYYETHKQLKDHLQLFLTAYNFAKRLKTLKGLTAYEYISQCWQNQKERFKINPSHHTLGLNT